MKKIVWGNHCEYTYTNRHYGNGGAAVANIFTANMQSSEWGNPGSTAANQVPGLNCYLAALESHKPNAPNDGYRWIPPGLPYDLWDNRNDNNANTVIDNVFGYSYAQSFDALRLDVKSIPEFRSRLLQQNANNQQIQVNALFNEYNY